MNNQPINQSRSRAEAALAQRRPRRRQQRLDGRRAALAVHARVTHRVLEADLFTELKEFEDITSDTASEAVKEAPIAIYVK